MKNYQLTPDTQWYKPGANTVDDLKRDCQNEREGKAKLAAKTGKEERSTV